MTGWKERIRDFLSGILFRSIAVVLVALLSFVALMALITALGSGTLLKRWETSENLILRKAITDRIRSAQQLDGMKILETLPVTPAYLLIQDDGGESLFFWKRGDPTGGIGKNFIKKMSEESFFFEVALPSGPVYRVASAVPPFDEYESNRLLLAASGSLVLWAGVFAGSIAVLFALVLSRPLSAQAKSLSLSLVLIGNGRRNVKLPRIGVRELDEIASGTEDLQAALGREEGLRRQWAADIAHDLRTPISALKGQFEGMLDGVFPLDTARIEKNHREVLILEQLVHSLSELTRIESPGFTVQLSHILFDDIVTELRHRFARAAKARGLTLVFTGEKEAALFADETLLLRALSNLVDNAVRYGEPGNITVSIIVDPDSRYCITVENPGLIDPEVAPFVFERLFRADKSRSQDGSGLGLAIVQAIAKAHGGEIRLSVDENTRTTRFDFASSPVLYPRSSLSSK